MTEVVTLRVGDRVEKVPLLVTRFGASYAELHNAAIASGYDVRMPYEHNGFKNAFHDANVAQHEDFGYWAEIFPDKVKGREKEIGETSPGEGFTPVLYVAHAGRPHELQINGWAPRNGLYVPVRDDQRKYRFFKPGTLIPERVISLSNRAEAEAVFRQFDIPTKEISGFYNSDNYNEWRFVGRRFCPERPDFGRFGVYFGGLPGYLGLVWVGCRSADEIKSVMEITLPEETVAQAK